ncbi:MAG: hypothetical protein AAGD43_15030 [Pseudomonadota bacterium]
MQPFDRWTHGTQLLKLLNEIDQCRVELDQAVARSETELADKLLEKFRDLAATVDTLAELENKIQPMQSESNEERLASEA